MMITLDMLRPGDRAVVAALTGDGPVSQRLAEMGMFNGANLEVVRFAPLGDPMEVLLDGYHLSLRKSEASLVSCERCE